MPDKEHAAIELTAIGSIRTGFDSLKQCPRSARFNPGESIIELDPQFADGLLNIDLASHLLVLYWLDRADRTALIRKARAGEVARGVFASRAPNRPNPVAVSVVTLLGREGNRLQVSGLDCLDKTPLIDIKPYVPDDDRIDDAHIGWNSVCTASPPRSATPVVADNSESDPC